MVLTRSIVLKLCFFLIATSIITFFLTQTDAEEDAGGAHIKWGYKGHTGPEHWAQLSPSFSLCATGQLQSPINIPKLLPTQTQNLSLEYVPSVYTIVEDGETHLQLGTAQILFKDGHGIQVNFHNRAKEWLTWQGKQFRLVQFHFHSPSENEWQGRDYPLEIHFVHQGALGEVLVVGVFVKAGTFHHGLQKIINHLPQDRGVQHMVKNEMINPIDFIPIKHDYYHFLGSLTTPPCAEGVQWIVMAEAITASPGQIMEIRKAAGGANSRPVQPLHHREIYYSEAT